MWGDSYQAPHPYSIHEFLPQSTMKLFDRAFVKGQKRPTAAEWQAELDFLLKNLKHCKRIPTTHILPIRDAGYAWPKNGLRQI